jgi:hypothetical protein
MTKKSPVCADCGERLDPWLLSQMDYFGACAISVARTTTSA